MDTKFTESSRKNRKERKREWVRLEFCRMSANSLIRVLEIGLMFGDMKLGSNPRHIFKHLNSFAKHKIYE